MKVYILMGVSGVGKTTLGKELANSLHLPFYDADDFHPKQNIEKMKNGIPLTDEDRAAWLDLLALKINEWKNRGAVLACSALKEKYRKQLAEQNEDHISWIYLYERYEVIKERIESRSAHYFNSDLLRSQFESLEPPNYGIHIKVNHSVNDNLNEILQKIKHPYIGLIGLGVMGKSLVLNMLSKNIPVAVYNRELKGVEENVASNFAREHIDHYSIPAFNDLQAFVKALPRPRNIFLMVKAGIVVDKIIEEILPFLEEDDLIIDGGNSHYKDTKRRVDFLHDKKMNFLGVGISGGEKGALLGPSIMPGGSKAVYERIRSAFEEISAKDKDGKPCCAYIGEEGAGHFVKMLHNGIEYGEMQLIAEFYQYLRFFQKKKPAEIADIFENWNRELQSYLLEISHKILRKEEDGKLLLDNILDVAGQKGTGGWSSIASLELGVSLDTITAAVLARIFSGDKVKRVDAAEKYSFLKSQPQTAVLEKDLFNAFKMATIINHSIGFTCMLEASKEYKWDLNLSEIARIWTNGCIIKSALMVKLVDLLKDKNQSDILLHPEVIAEFKTGFGSFKDVLVKALQDQCSMPVTSAAYNYFLNYTSAQTSANLIQAQRDFFGAHTYERIDAERGKFFTTFWEKK
ncbi:NADP-dependent phosphogluconate dehydrogenase [Gramella sp. AN32]|uniref:6-phosphogluconate dehydrogenase, decarboxylating n=1 Tax=Christiangramia antarctica TaxID=2058158 RepID=A0ABW5X093_9FLAO|nr:NADP-dependent phosphogluconate dehydrogenase [Gramella sp. AN32]MCM4156859.1 phosphogluconate dehydrogenase (NADP(+)-dependent, decarboxylating) [Gramella sp. AN32]